MKYSNMVKFKSQQSIFKFLFLNFTIPIVTVFFIVSLGTLYFFQSQQEKKLSAQFEQESLYFFQDTAIALTFARNKYIQSANMSILEFIKTLYNRQLDEALSKSEVIWLTDEVLKKQKTDSATNTFILNREGKILIHPDNQKVNSTHPYLSKFSDALEDEVSFITYASEETDQATKAEIIAAVSYFPQYQWVIVTELPSGSSSQIVTFKDFENLVKTEPGMIASNKVFFDNNGSWFSSCANGSDCTLPAAEMLMLEKITQEKVAGRYSYTWNPSEDVTALNKIFFFEKIKPFEITAGLVKKLPTNNFLFSNRVLEFYFLLIVITCALLVVTYLLNKRISNPFKRFSNIAEKKFDQVKPIPASFPFTELNELAHQYNNLVTIYKKTEQEKVTKENNLKQIKEKLTKEIEENIEATSKLTAEILSRKSAENYLQLFKNIFDNAIEGIMITDHENKILTVNPSFTEVTGYSAREVTGKDPRVLSSGKQSLNFYRKLWLSLEEKGSWSGEILNRKKDGTEFPEWLSISQIRDSEQKVTNYFAFFHDITELKRKEQQITAMAYQDALTKLPNRAALELRLTKAISRAKRENANLAVLFIDLDNFKNVNDTLGHDKGDQLLIQVAERIKVAVRDEDTLSRLGGDEFILLSEALENENSIFVIAGRILNSLKEPFVIGHSKLFINASIGIATYPDDGRGTNELIKNADMAMYKAKSEGKNKFVMFTQQMQEKFVNHIRIENAIRSGLHNREFVLYYQPKIDIQTQKATSFEALVRWNRNGKIIGPNEFISIAEESGLIDKMSLYLLEEACKFLQHIKRIDIEPLPVSVNMAPKTFNNMDIVETIDTILSKYEVDHKYIEFEVTETTAMENIQHTLDTMERFRQRGISFSIDDFGTGYSSLSYLNEMPVSTLKIDKRFINLNDSNCKSIVSTITAMSKQMQLKVVAEGVETSEQLTWLKSLGCDEAQGYYFARPFPQEDVIDYLKNNK